MSGNLAVSAINGVDISASPVVTESKVIGVGQTWQDVTGSRVAGTTYTNSTGKPIQVVINGYTTGLALTVSGVLIPNVTANGTITNATSAIIPNGATYSEAVAFMSWKELR